MVAFYGCCLFFLFNILFSGRWILYNLVRFIRILENFYRINFCLIRSLDYLVTLILILPDFSGLDDLLFDKSTSFNLITILISKPDICLNLSLLFHKQIIILDLSEPLMVHSLKFHSLLSIVLFFHLLYVLIEVKFFIVILLIFILLLCFLYFVSFFEIVFSSDFVFLLHVFTNLKLFTSDGAGLENH